MAEAQSASWSEFLKTDINGSAPAIEFVWSGALAENLDECRIYELGMEPLHGLSHIAFFSGLIAAYVYAGPGGLETQPPGPLGPYHDDERPRHSQ